LGRLYQDLIIAATMQDLIDLGYLSKFRVFAPAHPDLKGVRTVAGDYHEGDLGSAMDKRPLVADIVSTWLKLGRGRPTLCFAVNRVHAQHIRDKFEEAGVRAGYVDCFSTPSERIQVRSRFASGEFQVVCNVGVLTMGVDWDARCIILARRTKSEMFFVQIIGRRLRPAADKDHCLILDHSDTTSRLGFVTDFTMTNSMTATGASAAGATASSFPKNARCAPAYGRLQRTSARTAASRPSRSTKCELSMASCPNSTATSGLS
jgi:DNA repair protein RadD